MQTTEGRGKPFLVTEIGAGGIYGFRSPYGAKWSEEYQAKALGAQLEAVLGAEDCAGVYLWQFCDIRVSDEWWGVRPRPRTNRGVSTKPPPQKLCAEAGKKISRKTKNRAPAAECRGRAFAYRICVT